MEARSWSACRADVPSTKAVLTVSIWIHRSCFDALVTPEQCSQLLCGMSEGARGRWSERSRCKGTPLLLGAVEPTGPTRSPIPLSQFLSLELCSPPLRLLCSLQPSPSTARASPKGAAHGAWHNLCVQPAVTVQLQWNRYPCFSSLTFTSQIIYCHFPLSPLPYPGNNCMCT